MKPLTIGQLARQAGVGVALFLMFAVGALAFRAKRRRGYTPFVVGTVAAITLLVGKFAFDSEPILYAVLECCFVHQFGIRGPSRPRLLCRFHGDTLYLKKAPPK